jgi:hypothetical protein
MTQGYLTMISKTTTQKVAVTGVAAVALAASTRVRVVRLFSDRVVHVSVAPNAEATTATAMPINAFVSEQFSVPANAAVSVILADGEPSGNLWITEQ